MASTDQQILNLDAELDALSTPTTAQVYATSRDYDADVVAASGVSRAIGGGGGGGFAIGSSYLIADTVNQTGLASAAIAAGQFVLNDADGSDISINAGDDTLIDIATTGWYSIATWANLGPDTTGKLAHATLHVVRNVADIAYPVEIGTTAVATEYVTIEWSMPAMELTAGDVLTVTASADVGADTWNYFGAPEALWIVRFS